MKQTAGKVFARNFFYENFVPSLLPARLIRSSNFLTLLGDDFRELDLLDALEVPRFRVFSIEKDLKVYERQRNRNRREDLGVALYYGDLAEYIHSYLFTDHRITVFNLDICGSFLTAVDPVLGQLLLFARRNPSTVMATYSSAGRDRGQLMEGLKSLVTLLWLAPEATDRLIRHIYSQYRSAALAVKDQRREEASKNMLLRHLFWLRSHMEHIMIGSYSVGATDGQAIHRVMAAMDECWRHVIETCPFPLTYESVLAAVQTMPKPNVEDIRMDMGFDDIELLTYAANDGFYHNCYFATYESDGSTLGLETWLIESSLRIRKNSITLIDENGNPYPTMLGQIAVHTDRAVLWGKGDLPRVLRVIPVPLSESRVETPTTPSEEVITPDTIEQIRALAREHPEMNSREISEKLSLRLPLNKVAAHVAVARRKT